MNIRSNTFDNENAIEISGTGPGRTPIEFPRIFERYYRVEKLQSDKKGRGIGLGFSISNEIVDAPGGSNFASLNSQQVVTFGIQLPAFIPTYINT